MDKIYGFHQHRLALDDPYHAQEVAFAEAFSEQSLEFWEQVVFGVEGARMPKDILSEREINIIASVIQWLGTPVGKSFVEKAGFTYNSEPQK